MADLTVMAIYGTNAASTNNSVKSQNNSEASIFGNGYINNDSAEQVMPMTTASTKAPVATGSIKQNGGKIEQGNITYCYNPGGKLAGIVENMSDGKQKIMDANGNTMYYMLDETSDGDGNVTYFDKNNTPKYREYHDMYKSCVFYEFCYLDADGDIAKTCKMEYNPTCSDGATEADKNLSYNAATFCELEKVVHLK